MKLGIFITAFNEALVYIKRHGKKPALGNTSEDV